MFLVEEDTYSLEIDWKTEHLLLSGTLPKGFVLGVQ